MSGGETTSHDVTLEWPDGRTRTIAVREDETILDAADRADVALPYGCLTGACATCTGRLLEADGARAGANAEGSGASDSGPAIAYRRPPRALKERHRTDGYVLLCIATPRTDCRIAVGAGVRTELVTNPWK